VEAKKTPQEQKERCRKAFWEKNGIRLDESNIVILQEAEDRDYIRFSIAICEMEDGKLTYQNLPYPIPRLEDEYDGIS